MDKVLLLHYSHPEGYPPTLNAINCLAEKADQIRVLAIDTLPTRLEYSKNVDLILLEGEHDRFQYIKRSKLKKLNGYFNYVKQVRKHLKSFKPDVVLIYDNVPFLFYLFARSFLTKRHHLWYHNHDIYPQQHYQKYSVNWFAFHALQKWFNTIDYFSLPAMERRKMFPLKKFNGKTFFIPNFPSRKIVKVDLKERQKNKRSEYLKVIYPGSPSIKNGFEELIDVMNQKINGKLITLTIVGDINENYKKELIDYASSKGVVKQVYFEERIPYTEMSTFLTSYHIGWGMYKPLDLSVSTAGTSSNKIYEFLANAMPVIVFDNNHHKEYLSDVSAIYFSDLSAQSVLDALTEIERNYDRLSSEALNEYKVNFQFEKYFDSAMNEVLAD